MKNIIITKIKNMSDNNRIVVGNVIGAFAVKGLSLIVSLFTMPAYIAFFNNEAALGLWFTVLSVISWILNFDLGIGNGLRNHLTRELAEKNELEAKKYISSAYVIVGFICAVILIIFLLAFKFINWNFVFNIDDDIVSNRALLLTIQITFAGIMLQLFLKLIQSILYAIQKSSVNNFLSLATSLITLIAVKIIPPGNNDNNMVVMAVIHLLAVAIPLIIATIVAFLGRELRRVKPSIKHISSKHIKSVISLGGVFFLIQVVYMLIINSNEYLVTLLSSTENVVVFRIYNQIFTLGSTIFALTLTPIWSVVTKATAERNILWIHKLYKRLLRLSFIGVCCEFLIVTILQVAVNIWLGSEAITTNYLYGLIFAISGSMIIFVSVISSIANGIGELKAQVVFYSIGFVVKIVLSVLFVRLFNSWIGVQVANIIAMLPYCIIQPIWLHKWFNNNLKGLTI